MTPREKAASFRAFKKRFGPMTITTGYGFAIEDHEQNTKQMKQAWDAGVKWALRNKKSK